MKIVRTSLCMIMLITFIMQLGVSVAEESEKSKVVAIVNGKKILESDVNHFVDMLMTRLNSFGQSVTPEREKTIRKQGIDQMISREVLLQKAIADKVTVSDANVEKSLAAVMKQPEINQSAEDIKETIRTNMMINKMIHTNVISKIVIDDLEAENFYNAEKHKFKQPKQVRARHILIKVFPTDSNELKNESRKKINRILAKTKQTDFVELAKKFSEGPSAENGGDLDYFKQGEMVPPFDKVVFSLKKGEISGVVETQFGFHIIKVEDIKEAQTVPFSELKDRIKGELTRRKGNEKIDEWIDGLRKKANIELL